MLPGRRPLMGRCRPRGVVLLLPECPAGAAPLCRGHRHGWATVLSSLLGFGPTLPSVPFRTACGWGRPAKEQRTASPMKAVPPDRATRVSKSGGRGALPASGVAQTPAGRVPQAPRGPCWGSKLTREGPHRTRVRTRVRHPESWRRDEPPSRSAHPITGASTAHRRRLSGRHSLLAATRLFSGPFLPADRRARPPAGARARVAPGSVGRWGHRSRRGAGWSSKRGARGEAQPGVAVHSVAARHQGGLAVSVYKSINSSIANSPLPRGV